MMADRGTENGTGSRRGTESASGTSAGNWTGEAARLTGSRIAGAGGAGSAAGVGSRRATDCAGDAAGRSRRLRSPWSPERAGTAEPGGGRKAAGRAEEGKRRGEEWSESRRCCGC